MQLIIAMFGLTMLVSRSLAQTTAAAGTTAASATAAAKAVSCYNSQLQGSVKCQMNEQCYQWQQQTAIFQGCLANTVCAVVASAGSGTGMTQVTALTGFMCCNSDNCNSPSSNPSAGHVLLMSPLLLLAGLVIQLRSLL